MRNRLYGHICERVGHSPKACWLRHHYNLNHEIKIEELDKVESENVRELRDELYRLEMFYISLFKSWGIRLLNFTRGGDGYTAGHTEKTKELLRRISTGRKRGKYKWTPDGIQRIKDGRKKIIGKKHSQATKDAIGFAQIGGKNHMAKAVICVETNKEYGSIIDASRELKVNRSGIEKCCKGLAKTAGGFHFKLCNNGI